MFPKPIAKNYIISKIQKSNIKWYQMKKLLVYLLNPMKITDETTNTSRVRLDTVSAHELNSRSSIS